MECLPAAPSGLGYAARSGARLPLQHGHEALALSRILAITSPDNVASQRVLEAAGMHVEDQRPLAGEERETWVYAWSSPTARDAAPQ
jgi:[ribosomal protein S5]-alanine N-acetyltransferase